jgi:hypothetical protein
MDVNGDVDGSRVARTVPSIAADRGVRERKMTQSERGAQIRETRQRQGLSIYRAAVRARVHPNTVRMAELGATSDAMIEKIARALGVSEQATP